MKEKRPLCTVVSVASVVVVDLFVVVANCSVAVAHIRQAKYLSIKRTGNAERQECKCGKYRTAKYGTENACKNRISARSPSLLPALSGADFVIGGLRWMLLTLQYQARSRNRRRESEKNLLFLVVISLVGPISAKIIKTVTTRCHILKLKCTKFHFGWGSAPNPAGELTALPKPPSWN